MHAWALVVNAGDIRGMILNELAGDTFDTVSLFKNGRVPITERQVLFAALRIRVCAVACVCVCVLNGSGSQACTHVSAVIL